MLQDKHGSEYVINKRMITTLEDTDEGCKVGLLSGNPINLTNKVQSVLNHYGSEGFIELQGHEGNPLYINKENIESASEGYGYNTDMSYVYTTDGKVHKVTNKFSYIKGNILWDSIC